MGYKRKEYENMESLFTNGKKKFVKYEEGAAMYSMGIHAFTELAKEAKAFTPPPIPETTKIIPNQENKTSYVDQIVIIFGMPIITF